MLQQKTITYNLKKVVNLYVVYEITSFHSTSSDPRLTNALFGADKLTKIADIDKYKYFGNGIEFDGHDYFSHPSGGTGRNVIIFGVDMNTSSKIENKGKYILILGKGPTQRLSEHLLSAQKMYFIKFHFH